ncbi:MAG: phosphatidylinositol-3-phosphatase [Solirubrobacteraceae bacterium]|nr:phosphatidylinositol-3-phosphatase [Solirubrobacteraceae bacterium]
MRAAIIRLALLATGLCALAVLAGCGASRAGAPLAVGKAGSLPASGSSHVVVVVMENAEYGEVIGKADAPYINGLARRYGLAGRSHAITHPSLPNYLALTSGSTQGIESDCTSCEVSAPNIVDSLQTAQISWKAYMEDLPRPCFTGAQSGGYAKKHDPFAYYRDVIGNPSRCGRIVGFGALAADLRSGALPSFAWVSPNLCDDGHDCSLRTADGFLARTLPALIHELGPHGFLVLTWDEGTSDAGCCGVAHGGRVATIVVGPDVRPGGRSSAPVDHYGVLASVEDALGLPRLAGSRDPRAGSLRALFARAPRLH